MQEVFEKIIEKLEEENSRLKRLRNNCIALSDSEVSAIENKAYNFSIEIVQQEAEKYNNGWIPCSERVPKVEDLHEKSVDDCTCYLIQRRCGIMDVAHYIKVYGEPYFEANSIKMKDVVAWMPLPEQYKPKFVQKCVNPSSKEEIEELNKKIRSIPVCTYPTNADRIRSLSDEELAVFLCKVKADYQWTEHEFPSDEEFGEWVEWLQSEVEEQNGNIELHNNSRFF